jgi:hypothetical protein
MEEDEMGRACSTYGRRQERNTSRVLVGKPERYEYNYFLVGL